MNRRLVSAALLAAVSAWAQSPAGRWDGTIDIRGVKIPFRLFFEGGGAALMGSFVNGDARITATSGSFENGKLLLSYDQFGTRLQAALANGELKGVYGSQEYGTYPFTASAYCTCGYDGEAGPDITGAWELPGLKWRLSISRKGEDSFATIERTGGSLGPFSGRFDGLTFTLHFFDGNRSAVIEIEPRKDSGLDVTWRAPGEQTQKQRAVRSNL